MSTRGPAAHPTHGRGPQQLPMTCPAPAVDPLTNFQARAPKAREPRVLSCPRLQAQAWSLRVFSAVPAVARTRAKGPPQPWGPTSGPAVLRLPGPSHRRDSPAAGSGRLRSSGPSPGCSAASCSRRHSARGPEHSTRPQQLRVLATPRVAPTPLLSRLRV
ncbi:hypothetical protein NDU88_003689 [Pleurodeles waltl]|uniref:Uncharacterized protein n=1 Tax=Pleurodeles waltl TaxID=8319 RepID=A0AAV7M456_PLEWA|nr:hypothetical protein NDU88_003689 [Pleurodeles waltl]